MLFQGAIVDDDDIGHGRPPKRTQFKPGVSGNPKGRPKRKPADVSEVIKDALSGNISIIQQRLSGVFSLRLCKFRDERPCDNFKKTAIGGHISHLCRNYLRLF